MDRIAWKEQVMAIIGGWFAKVGNRGGKGERSSTVSWRFASPVNISAQASMGAYGGVDPWGEVGFSDYVQDGRHHPPKDDRYGSWAHLLWADRVTQVDISARSYDAYIKGTAIAYWWE
jgi:hypothetical protein